MDMSGNVGERVSDWFSHDYYGSSPAINPTGPVTGTYRDARRRMGFRTPRDMRTANRDTFEPEHRAGSSGSAAPAIGYLWRPLR